MKLTQMGHAPKIARIAFVGNPEPTGLFDRDNEQYWLWNLKNPVIVSCSTNREIVADFYEALHVRESVVDSDLWEFVNGKDDTEGIFIPKYVADFLTGPEIAAYQETTARKYVANDRRTQKTTDTEGINARIRAKINKS